VSVNEKERKRERDGLRRRLHPICGEFLQCSEVLINDFDFSKMTNINYLDSPRYYLNYNCSNTTNANFKKEYISTTSHWRVPVVKLLDGHILGFKFGVYANELRVTVVIFPCKSLYGI
jgi:hypothetical protein